jgi:hypothetical protein
MSDASAPASLLEVRSPRPALGLALAAAAAAAAPAASTAATPAPPATPAAPVPAIPTAREMGNL